jgi:23S rRNA (adenine2503-C2)-methyltransferase
MACTFCATGKLGFQENLSADEIVDQYRFWKKFLSEKPQLAQRISNMVFMGMGEPLANYENVKESINTLLKYTDIGPTHITVSTVGVIPKLNELLTDPAWPHVRIAISLHSADTASRQAIVKSSYENFLDDLRLWCKKYLAKFGNKRHHVTFEYVLLKGKTDTAFQAEALAKYVRSVGRVKVNLIPFNFVSSTGFDCPTDADVKKFKNFLESKGIQVMIRKNMGRDIDAACGQLVVQQNINS